MEQRSHIYTKICQNKIQTNIVRRSKEGHFIIMKGKTHEDDIRILNTYSLNIDILNFIKQIPLKSKTTN